MGVDSPARGQAMRRTLRAVTVVLVLAGALAFILTSCPSNRDGMPGQLASAKDDAQSAARSGALALQLWAQHQSTRDLTAVQLADARDQVVKAYQGIATLKAEDPADLARQTLLTRSMTEMVSTLNDANAAVRALPDRLGPPASRQRLLDAADALDRDYR
jgi:hypothetical protein